MLAEVVDAIVKLMLFVSMVSATQLVAAWAVVSRRPLAWRLAVPIVGMFSLWIGWRATEEPDNAGAMITLLSLEMLKVALVLAIAKGIAQHGLQFSLRGMLVVTALCAVLLAAFGYVQQGNYLEDFSLMAVLSLFSTITIAALWAALSPIHPAQRASLLALVICASAIVLWPSWVGLVVLLLFLLAFTTHALIVVAAARVWVTWQRASAPSNNTIAV